jgi:hypothetical protein
VTYVNGVLTIINANPIPPSPPAPIPPTPTPMPDSLPSIIFSYLYALSDPAVSAQYDTSIVASSNYGAAMQELDSGKAKCVSMGAIKICTSAIKSTEVNF